VIVLIAKYIARGWPAFANSSEQHPDITAPFYIGHDRFVDNTKCWKVPLDITEIQYQCRLSSPSEDIEWDPVIQNSWSLHVHKDTQKITPAFLLTKSWAFRFSYLSATPAAYDALTRFATTQTDVQWTFGKRLNATSMRYTWTWYAASPVQSCQPMPLYSRWDSIIPELLRCMRIH
jgi:hypothetical protein